MTKVGFIAIILGALLCAGAAEAQASRTWVSGSSGASDSNPCTRAQPCATFSGAYGKTSAGGEIDVLDGGDFGPLTIQHALTIANDGAGTAAITPASTDAVHINAGPADAVVLRGLNLNGVTTFAPGISFVNGGSLLVDHCKIQGFQAGSAIYFAANNAAKLWVRDTVLSNDGNSGNASVWIVPQSGGVATVHLEGVQILNAVGNGIRVDGTTSGAGPIDVELHDVTVDAASGGSGIVAVAPTTGGPTVKIVADDVTSSHNAGYGFRAVGGRASVYLSRSVIENNGVGIGESTGGVVYSYGDNRFANNTSDGVAPTPIGLK